MSTAAATSNAPDPESRAYAEKKRAEKRDAAHEIGVDAEYISSFVDRFYTRIRDDELLGPIFDARIKDWGGHLDRMKRFWRSVLHNSGEFSGNPMLKHLVIPGLELRHFARWLDLFYETLREAEPHAEATRLVASRARMIADSLLTGITMRREGLAGGRAGKELPYV